LVHLLDTVISLTLLLQILGPPSPAALLLLFVAAHCILDLSSEIERKSASSKSAFGFALAVFWHLLSTRWFYATGHQQQFNALQFSAPFVGFDKFNLVLGAIIMIVNTFASQMLCGFFVPFLAFWEGRPTLISGKKVGAAKFQQQIRHEEVLRRVPRPLETLARRTLFYVFIASFLFVNTLGLTFMMRRHLMVWRVFAPKFVFEAGALLVTDVAVLLGMVVTWRHTP
jgi:GPI ethanolamine phosphate transferase 3 subunit O